LGPIGFVWSDGVLTYVNGVSNLDAINDDGVAVGGGGGDGKAYQSYDTKTGNLTNVPVSFCKGKGKGSYCYALGINNAGEVVGASNAGATRDLGFVWANGAAQELLPPHEKQSRVVAINKAGDVIVRYGANQYYNPFVYHKGKFTQIAFPGALDTYPGFLTDSGILGGNYYTGANYGYGFVLSGGTYTTYSPSGSTFATVTGVGPAGQIVGTFNDAGGKTHGFEYASGTYYQIDVPNSTSTTISGVGATGMIFGYYTTSEGYYGFVGTCPKKEVCTQ
jgi:probable HAF family extracellular repeat protein